MYFAIDHDTRSVESKSQYGEPLAEYILDNNLSAAIALVDSEEELCLQLSLDEMQELSNNLGGSKEYISERVASEWCWRLLEDTQDNIPNFTKALGKRLLKEANKRNRDVPEAMGGPKAVANTGETSTTPKPKKPASERQRPSKKPASRPKEDTLIILGAQPKETTLLFKVWKIVDENLGEMTINAIIAECELELEERLVRRYITKMIRLGNLEIKDA